MAIYGPLQYVKDSCSFEVNTTNICIECYKNIIKRDENIYGTRIYKKENKIKIKSKFSFNFIVNML